MSSYLIILLTISRHICSMTTCKADGGDLVALGSPVLTFWQHGWLEINPFSWNRLFDQIVLRPFRPFLPCWLPSARVSLPLSSFRKLPLSHSVTRTVPFALPFLALLASQGLPPPPEVFPVAQTTLNPQKWEQGNSLVFSFSHVLFLRSFHFHLQFFQLLSQYSNLFFLPILFETELYEEEEKSRKLVLEAEWGDISTGGKTINFAGVLEEKPIPSPWLGTTYN